MKNLLCVLALAIIASGCGIFRSEPYPKYFKSLERKSACYIRKIPPVKLDKLASQSFRPNQLLPEKEILVSVSGGGARAAAFSLGVLAELENLGKWVSENGDKNALQEIDYFSTVSGGGWGVSAYLADRFQNGNKKYSLEERIPEIKNRFLAFSEENDSCLVKGIEKHITTGLCFGDLFKPRGDVPLMPYLFSNITIAGNQSPLLPIKEHLDYYHINTFFACGYEVQYSMKSGINPLPVSYAVATSGSVPGFHHSSATTDICDKSSDFYDSFFCSKGKVNYSHLTLVDGGVYDNYGYQTALEIMADVDPEKKKLILVIDSNADTEIPFNNKGSEYKMCVGINTLKKAGFPARTTAFNRMFSITAKALGIKTLVLDFFSASLTPTDLKTIGSRDILQGLDLLKHHAQNKVACFADDGTYIDSSNDDRRFTSADCILNNFYRSGLMGKTTYIFDEYYFTLLEQLGRLVVRLRADDLYQAIYN